PNDLISIGYTYHSDTDKWSISDVAADFIYIPNSILNFELPGTLRVITSPEQWETVTDPTKYLPFFDFRNYIAAPRKSDFINFVKVDCYCTKNGIRDEQLIEIAKDKSVVFCLSSKLAHAMPAIRRMIVRMMDLKIDNPVILMTESSWASSDEHLIHFATETGALLLDGMGDGISLTISSNVAAKALQNNASSNVSGRNYFNNSSLEQFLNTTAFGILQATRTRISKTEYISCPSCGRTLFELQETTAKIRSVTHHLKGLKIAIMGCIVNGPGEMADADFGYVGSGVGKITLYKGKEIMKKNIDSAIAVDELIQLLKEHNAWVAPK
ncbi:MAG: flavodoxin-dependent (E)-4-hydroxy-3-methylbut-2-enyl-diphosphate synthase, partial [Sediminibacterium sp.]